MDARTLAVRLDRELKVAGFEDASNNGLQVASTGSVRRVAVGVDASLAFFGDAVAAGADFLVVHHGLSWGDSLKRLTGRNFDRVAFLMRHNVALYACHLPLDAHPRLGNNIRICQALGLRSIRPFGAYHGRVIGFRGELPRALPAAAFTRLVEQRVGPRVQAMTFGPARVRRIGVVSGGAGDMVEQAADAGCDVFLSGEPRLEAYHAARERGIHALFAGHYATETFGVRAVGDWITRRLGIPSVYVPQDVPY